MRNFLAFDGNVCYFGTIRLTKSRSRRFHLDHTIVIDSDSMGVGDKKLGRKLLKTFLTLLCERHDKPRTVILYNSGVPVACEGSEVLDLLRHLEKDGVEILLCGTCLDYYKLREKIQVGTISNMGTIQDRMLTGKTVKT